MENDFIPGESVTVSRGNVYDPAGTRGTVIKSEADRVLIYCDNGDKCWLSVKEIIRVPTTATSEDQ